MSRREVQEKLQRAFEHHRAARFREAEVIYRAVLADHPESVDALYLLGSLAAQTARPGLAAELLGRVVALDPYHNDALNNLGKALNDLGRFEEAAAICVKAIRLKADYPGSHHNLGMAMSGLRRHTDAVSAFSRAVELHPGYADAHNGMGLAFKDMQDFPAAEAALIKAIRANPAYASACNNLGNVFMEQGKVGQAAGAFEAAVRIHPAHLDARRNLALVHLLVGDFDRGWVEYEGRASRGEWDAYANIPQPRWDGGDLAGRTILLHAEQGFGDTIQFVRYAALVAERGGTVLVECQPELKRLLHTAPGVSGTFARGEALPPFDTHNLLLSLPLIFGTRLDTIPSQVPYLTADPALSEKWASAIAGAPAVLNVGLAWAGSETHPNNRNRSMSPGELAPLAVVPGIRFHGLQPSMGGPGISGLACLDHTAALNDFADTAALISRLDLVITVDTAVAHLAGALGKPVWVMLPWVPDWRWLLDRADSPWYPTMRLFRQPAPQAWAPVVAGLESALRAFAADWRE